MTLLETYGKRLNVSESVYKKTHGGEALSNTKKIAVATLLNNVNRFMNESFANSVGTQRADLGQFKKFCLNLTTVAVPNLIAPELVIVHPLTSISGYITYVQYTAGSNKGQTTRGNILNDPFRLGTVDPNYTSSAVVESVASAGTVTPTWTPIVLGAFVDGTGAKKDAKFVAADGTVTYLTASAQGTFTVAGAGKIAYEYDNIKIPQNDLPIVNAQLASIALVAKARRVAVYYSQMAAFQAKTDYGFDLGDQLAEKACGQLAYEIDTEVTNLLIDHAAADASLVFNKTLPVGVNKADHYEGFNEVVEIAKQLIYDRTKRYVPNYMICSSSVLPVLSFIKDWKAAPTGTINGPYFAGTLGPLKVFVTPNIATGKFVMGVNGDDMMSSAAVYAPYMAVIPTQLLGYADGGMSQGFSTMYALEMLNADLLVAGSIVEEPRPIDVIVDSGE